VQGSWGKFVEERLNAAELAGPVKGSTRFERAQLALRIGQEVASGEENAAAVTMIDTGGTGGVARSPQDARGRGEVEGLLKRRDIRFGEEIGFLFVDDEFAPKGLLNGGGLVDRPTMGNHQPIDTTLLPQKGFGLVIPGGAIDQ